MKKINIIKTFGYILIDFLLINASFILTDILLNTTRYKKYTESYLMISIIFLISFVLFKIYKNVWHYASIDEFLKGIIANITAYIFSNMYLYFFNPRIHWKVFIINTIFIVMFTLGFKLSFRIIKQVESKYIKSKIKYKENVLIVGAGSAGTLLLREIKQNLFLNYNIIGFIDDDRRKIGHYIAGVKVLGDRNSIPNIVELKKIDLIIIAIPSLNNKNKVELINICKNTGCKVKILPDFEEMIRDDKALLKNLRDIKIEDLLRRDPINLDLKGIEEYITNKKVLVTGGGGSIGSELCRQISKFNPLELIILDINENAVYELEHELKFKYPNLNIKVIIASIRDKNRLDKIFNSLRPDIVFHAAAHKHVPLMENNPAEAVKNNIFGTLNLVECSDKYKVEKFVMISTDKAVNPTNIMGATKRVCEMIVQAYDKKSETEFVAVRFGNVLGSNGSVIPLFMKQIKNGGPVTVTHKDITRYFMTIPEACQLVMQAASFAKGGEIFVLDMGEPVKIYDLACDLIRLSGYEPNKDIEIKITGLRPGEKLYEELSLAEEGLTKTKNNKIFVAKPLEIDYNQLKQKLDELHLAAQYDDAAFIRNQLREIVTTYKSYLEVAVDC
ncbi:polysaccharide biosynthesis protein [Caloramator australicus]|uniref:UDP-N-acetylglucosamine 4,6-dehydratase n=1 Tax=Caloramator australicus RC3 TaxID=857293 RepID=G0V443_9CLOT|nr:nucleoside-diphosphate sugar epimerase/dehydratase [Caloramator australicus]CCC57883.1 UDP-N-acetylglucosamine 4,6-dehydratase [Caloramator australicus RC3]